ncbi:hypothetical protein KO481_12980 [Nocardia sp. NEAU-G5]|uniref:Transposase n=1 Tax=Nocardia albiluteola TaxID=2842303 RepID=A0ABS6AWM8_9NOCA|nr:hypothetical protein [Nocardia albiluteola]MBU3062432.1 hypothetical protein [Nocardia albiluteola]
MAGSATAVCADELGLVSPRTFGPAPGGRSMGTGSRRRRNISRGPGKIWVYGSIRVRDGQAVTLTDHTEIEVVAGVEFASRLLCVSY